MLFNSLFEFTCLISRFLSVGPHVTAKGHYLLIACPSCWGTMLFQCVILIDISICNNILFHLFTPPDFFLLQITDSVAALLINIVFVKCDILSFIKIY